MRLPDIPPALPEGATFAFGQSPFRVKGVLYLGTQTFFSEHVRGGMAALTDEIADPSLRAFIGQRFLPGSLYDVIPVPALIACEARAMRLELEDYLLFRTRHQAKKDLGGVYGWVLRMASPRMVATRMPKIMMQMFDFSTAEVARDEPHETVVRIGGIPEVLVPWLGTSLRVYAEQAIKLAGATVLSTKIAAKPAGSQAGLELTELTATIAW